MPRSAVDATRFTPTGPHAYSKANPSNPSAKSTSSPSPSSSSSTKPLETPQEKVARLREAARRARMDRLSTFDKVVLVGRVWADRAHRVVALGLIFSSAVCGIYATVALTDMVIYNRRKKKEWYDAEQVLYANFLQEATAAEASGTATEEQIRFLEKEKSILEAEEEQRNRRRIWKRTKEWLFSGLKRDDGPMESSPDRTGDELGEQKGGVLKAVEARRQYVARDPGKVMEAVQARQEEDDRFRRPEEVLATLTPKTSDPTTAVGAGGGSSWSPFKSSGNDGSNS